jgi:hypothetical protein
MQDLHALEHVNDFVDEFIISQIGNVITGLVGNLGKDRTAALRGTMPAIT